MKKGKGKERILNPKAEVFKRSKLPVKYVVIILFGWNNGKIENKYLKKLKRSWVRQKEKKKYVSTEIEP